MPPAPLEGVRILAVSQFGAGPFGTQVLADLGAQIIKIEDPEVGGDVSRYVPPYLGQQDSLYFQSFNRGKKSVAINLQHPDGQAVLRDLVDSVHPQLAHDGLVYRTVGIKVRFEDFETHTAAKSLKVHSRDREPIVEQGLALVRPFLEDGRKIRLLGVRLSNLRNERPPAVSLSRFA